MINQAFDPLLLARIEDAGLNASAPTQQRWVDGWLVRFAAGKAKRARCVNAVSRGRGELPARLQSCEFLFAQFGLPALFRITPFSEPADLDATLATTGMNRFDDTRVMVVTDLPEALAAFMPCNAVSIRTVGVEAFAQRVGGFRGSPLAHRQAHAERLRHSPVPIQAFELAVDGRAAACGQFALEHDLVGLFDVYTLPEHRRRGLAEHLCRHLLQVAVERGARHAYLQVDAENHSARSVYHRIGFVDAYSYHYRGRSEDERPAG